MQFEILMDKKENPRKCTILPLRDRKDFHIRYFHGKRAIPAFQSEVLLHMDGENLADITPHSIHSLALIDCIWRRVEPTLKKVEGPTPRLVKIPPGFITAYPRKNKQGNDPEGGLATIEALFIAASFLGIWDESLLEKYHFKNEFLELNKDLWEKYSLGNYGTVAKTKLS